VPLDDVRVHGDHSLLAWELAHVVQQRPQHHEGLQRQASRVAQETSSQERGSLNAEIATVIDAEHGHGHPIPGEARADLERHLGAEFSAVRLHTGPRADVLSRAVHAQAFTTGTDVFFRSGMYDPISSSGRRLLAHELTHVVQQTTGKISLNGGISQPTDAAEVRANEVARMFDQEAVADGEHGVSRADACCDSCAHGKSCETTAKPTPTGLTISRQATLSPGGPFDHDPCPECEKAVHRSAAGGAEIGGERRRDIVGREDTSPLETEDVSEVVVGRRIVPPASVSDGTQIQRYSWNEFTDDVSGVVDAVSGAAQAAGQGVAGAADVVAEGAQAVGEAISSGVSAVGSTVASALSNIEAALPSVRLNLPDVTLFDRHEHQSSFGDQTDDAPLVSMPVEVPYIGDVILTLFARGELLATLVVGVGPAILRQISLILDPSAGVYKGTGRLEIQADATGSLTLTGILGGSANWQCLVDVVKLEGGLSITGAGGLSTSLSHTVNIGYEDGEFTFENYGMVTPCLNIGLDLDALSRLIVLDYPIWSAEWNLASSNWSKCWPVPIGEAPGSGFKGGGGTSGGGGSTGSYEANPGGGSFGGGGSSDTFDDALVAPRGRLPFSARDVLNTAFSFGPPKIDTKPLPIAAIEKSGKKNPCPVPEDEVQRVREEIRQTLRVKYLHPGACAAGSIPASKPKSVPADDQRQIDAIGARSGCHHCDEAARAGHWIGDHQPATGLIEQAQKEPELLALMTQEGMPTTLAGQRLFPHSEFARVRQGGAISGIIGKLKRLKRLKGTP
jgi:hypothetical protein